MTEQRQHNEPNELRQGPQRSLFLHALFKDRLPRDRNFQLPLVGRLRSLRTTWRIGLLAWYLLAAGFAGWLGFTYYQNYQALHSGPGLHHQAPATETTAAPLRDLDRLRHDIETIQGKNRTLIISRFGFDQSLRYEKELKQRYVNLFETSLSQLEAVALTHWRKNCKDFSADQKQGYAKFLLGQWRIQSGAVGSNAADLQQYAALTDPFWRVLYPQAAEIPIGPLYLAYLQWRPTPVPNHPIHDYPGDIKNLLTRERGLEAAWLWAAPEITALPVAIEDFWIDFPQPGWIEVPGGLTLQGRTQTENFLKQLLQPLEKKDADTIADLFWQSYWQQFFTAWERFTSEFIEQGKLLSESPGNIVAAGAVLRQDGPYWRVFVRFSQEMKGIDDQRSRPSWVRQWQILAAGWDQFIENQTRKTGGVTDKLNALTANVVHKGEEFAGQRINLPVSVRDQLAELWASYLADLASLSPVTVHREERVDQFGKFFRGLRQGESSGFFSAYGDFRKLVTLDAAGAGDTLTTRLVFAPLDFLLQVALGETTDVLQQEWTETVTAPLNTQNIASQLAALFSQPDSPVPKFLAGPAAPFLELSNSGYRPRNFNGMSLPFRQDFLSFLFAGTRASKEYAKELSVTLGNLPMNVNPEAGTHPFYGKIEMQCANKQFVLENWNYADQAVFTWTPSACGDVILTLKFPGGTTLRKSYPGAMGFPQFLNDFKDGRQTYALKELSGDSKGLQEQKVEQVTIAYSISDAPDVRQWLQRIPTVIPDKLFVEKAPSPHYPASFDTLSAHPEAARSTSDAILKIPVASATPHRERKAIEKKVAVPALLPPTGDQTASDCNDSSSWILRQPANAVTIQLMSLRSPHTVKGFCEKYADIPVHWYRKTDAQGKWLVLIGGSFSSTEEAKAAIARLPGALKTGSPFVRSFKTIQAEMDRPHDDKVPDSGRKSP